MSDLAKRTAAPNIDALPGHEIPVARFGDYGLVEQEFERQHLSAATSAAVAITSSAGDAASVAEVYGNQLIHSATRNVASGMFRYPSYEFRIQAGALSALPLLLWTLLRHKNPKLTREAAGALVPHDDPIRVATVQRAVLEAFGYTFAKEEPKNDEKKSPEADSTSPTLPTGSTSNADSPTPTSQT